MRQRFQVTITEGVDTFVHVFSAKDSRTLAVFSSDEIKDKATRYAKAKAFADDWQRFLSDEG